MALTVEYLLVVEEWTRLAGGILAVGLLVLAWMRASYAVPERRYWGLNVVLLMDLLIGVALLVANL